MLYHIGISGGKDSTALLLWAIHKSGYPKDSIVVTFCNTHNEAEETYRHIEKIDRELHPVVTIEPDRGFYELAQKKGRFPSTLARFCTQELKMKPTKRFIDGLLAQGHSVLNHSGVRAEESHARAQLPAMEPAHLSYFGVPTFRPLLHWTLDDVKAIHAEYGFPLNPLYSMGCTRVGCYPCIMSSKAEIATITSTSPDRIDFLREQEEKLGSTFFPPNKVPIRFRSKMVQTRDGRTVPVCTIDDVVRWSKTGKLRRGRKFAPDKGAIAGDHRSPCAMGICE